MSLPDIFKGCEASGWARLEPSKSPAGPGGLARVLAHLDGERKVRAEEPNPILDARRGAEDRGPGERW